MKKYFIFFTNTQSACVVASCLLFLSQQASAQNITNQTNVFIPLGIEMHTDGNLTNQNFFQNNGSVFVGGDWANTAVYQGTGLVSLKGINQTIFNNNQTIEHLHLNGGGVKTLQGKLFINKKIDFVNGIFLVNDADTLVLNQNCEVISASSQSHVNGGLISEGNGYKFFPVGKNGKYHPVELLDVEGLNPMIEVEVFENLPPISTSIPTTLLQDIYWTRKTIAGRFDKSAITVGYDLQDPFNLERLIFAQGENFNSEFSIHDNVTVETRPDFDIVSSTRTLTGSIFALGELINDPPRPYYFSTTLSPNAGNAENRTVKVFGNNSNLLEFYFQVFNRWGLMIFESRSYAAMSSEGWDGKQKGSMLPAGVYPYSVKFIDNAGKATQNRGFITIIH